MPVRAPRLCSRAGCSTPTKDGYCSEHIDAALEAARTRRQGDATMKRYDERRGTPAARGYGTRWRKLRKTILDAEPLCRPCRAEGYLTAAFDVDHIREIKDGGTDEDKNLQPICRRCHALKSVKEKRARQRPGA